MLASGAAVSKGPPGRWGKWPCGHMAAGQVLGTKLSHESVICYFPFVIHNLQQFAPHIPALSPAVLMGQGQVLDLIMAVPLEGGEGSIP